MNTDDTKCHSVLDTESIDSCFRRNDICVIAIRNLLNLR